MTDPVSVASTAVGIASLGIQVCQGLVSYLRSIKGRRQEVADGLREVQTLLSIFDSLNRILPHIDQGRSIDSHVIRRCLKDSEEGLRQLQQLLVELNGTAHPSHLRDKMKDTGRALIYPFHEKKLTSLRQTLRGLLDNLDLAIDITSLKAGMEQGAGLDAIRNAVEDLQDASHLQSDRTTDLHTRIQENSDQLRSLRQIITDALGNIEQRLAQAEWNIRDLDQNISGKFTLIQNDIASNSILSAETVTRLVNALDKANSKLDAQSTNIASMSVQISQMTEQTSGKREYSRMILQSSPPPSSSLLRRTSDCSPSAKTALSTVTATGHKAMFPVCGCQLKTRSESYLYNFRVVKFKLDQHIPPDHRQGCKFHGIKPKAERTAEAQFPIKMIWFFGRIIQISVACTTGSGHPGISVRFKNIVPERYSPVCREINGLMNYIREYKIECDKVALRIKSCEHTVLSMYKERKASPTDRDEMGRNHAMFLIYEIGCMGAINKIVTDELILTAFMQLLHTLVEIGQTDGERINIGALISPLCSNSDQYDWTNARRMIAYLTGVFEIDPSKILEICGSTHDDNMMAILSHLPDLTDAMRMQISPMAHAILSRSLEEMDYHILHNSEAPMQHISGFTTLQLCATWPEGLRRLLDTDAKSLIDSEGTRTSHSPVFLAAVYGCARSVDILMKAGCEWDMGIIWRQVFPYFNLRNKILFVVASNIAERRWKLLELAEQELGIPQHPRPSYVPDDMAAELCEALDIAGISIPPLLRVPRSYATIYHNSGHLITDFPMLFEMGFRDYKSYNCMGLTPIMVWRGDFSFRDPTEEMQLLSVFPRLCKEGLLDQKPEDPLGLGINVHATGWHYIATFLKCPYSKDLTQQYLKSPLIWKIIRPLSQVPIRDNCTCWCIPDGKGCSPLTSMWKSDIRPFLFTCLSHSRESGNEFIRHIYFHDNYMLEAGGDDLFALQLEFVRFLTFEALDMEHTCCASKPVGNEGGELRAIVNCKPEKAEKIRSDSEEQKNAHLLGALMEEFAARIRAMEKSPKALECFIWGYWRRRMSELFSANAKVVDEMERVLDNVQTHILPEKVFGFLGYDFDLIKIDTRGTYADGNNEHEDDEDDVEDVELSPHCRFCDD
ncbi:hypothetical protein K449DRAFT_467338 [Hypoxylon sp. EC38]|nr:hypothetical protein K449DRAFT_467338 [Hypoxylon sp. EC38]